ncbi:hypothetical protein [Paraburkholderia sediminicola]|uniref:hypothetical protein n=1 Tax=Paraburkholderia sediminicola TaxID=458836 RepID=UPI0038BCC5F1
MGYIPDLEEGAADGAKRIEELDARIGRLEEQIRVLQAERYAPKIASSTRPTKEST